MTGGGPLRGLSRGMQVFLLVDVLLVIVLVVLLATLPERSAQGDDVQGATPSPTASAAAADAGQDPSADAVGFTLPSGNIACEMSAEGVVCTIGSFTYAPPRVTGCEAETGHVVRLDAEGFGFRCEEDGVPRLLAGDELAYGARETVGDYTCASGTDGVTCTDAAGVGFRLARAQWNALP